MKVPRGFSKSWKFWIDVGGTFTDCIALAPDGTVRRRKVLSSGVVKGRVEAGSTPARIICSGHEDVRPGFFRGYTLTLFNAAGAVVDRVRIADSGAGRLQLERPLRHARLEGAPYEIGSGEPAPLLALRMILGLRLRDPIPPADVRLGTTRATNALLEGKGAPTLFVTTRGFGDALRIGTQARPDLFDLEIRKPPLLYRKVVELDERTSADGRILRRLNEESAVRALRSARGRLRSAAICFLNAHVSPRAERVAERAARKAGFEHVSVSSKTAPRIGFVARANTTVLDAALTPLLRDYVRELRRALRQGRLRFMTSAGGLVEAEAFSGKDSLFSGPAGGVVGFSHAAECAGFRRAIGFDMGGTSTDVSRFDGTPEMRFEVERGGGTILAPMLAIETVAAGGGSICGFDGQKPVVGPESAGADPGPACYGRGGPLTLTDVNLLLGRLPGEMFPFPLDRDAARARLEQRRREFRRATGRGISAPALAEGYLRIANANMAAPIRRLTLEKGVDPSEHVLVSFGSAGGQHACAVARHLGIRTVLHPPHPGLLSAFGVGVADVRRYEEMSVLRRLDSDLLGKLKRRLDRMERRCVRRVRAEGVSRILPGRRMLDLRYTGQDYTITVEMKRDPRASFVRAHRRRYGYIFPRRPVEVVSARVEVTGETEKPGIAPLPRGRGGPEPFRFHRAVFDGRPRRTGIYRRNDLRAGDRFRGPAIVLEDTGTIVIEPGWEAETTRRGDLVVRDRARGRKRERIGTGVDPIRLEIFGNRFRSIAEQMGVTLQRSSLSVNVKERMDFSCAIFTPEGDLVVNAPHIPVHLGAMQVCLRRVKREIKRLREGDVIVTNDPFRGGSHIPDVTVLTPVFDRSRRRLLFFVGNRAHHAEIGGKRPGSMPPDSTNLAEEGVRIRNFKVVDGGRERFRELEALLRAPPFPSRAPRENLADLSAQIAANRRGAELLGELVDRYGRAVVHAYMRHFLRAAERKMRAALRRVPDGTYRFRDALDDGSPISVRIDIRGGTALVDFEGTGPVVPGNLNANPAIVTAAVLYVFRTMLREDIPLNAGVLAPIRIRVPRSLLNPPEHEDPARCAAVAGGNVETSQRVVDVLLGALRLAAASQGTMNNLSFGNERFAFYETICGGAGAGPGFNGADAVHTHMTNTRLTDVEVLESRFPVRVRRFSIRPRSGGSGRWRGGRGVVREIEFLEPVEGSILSQRRTRRPFGLQGGGPGAPGRNLFRGRRLGPVAGFSARKGDVLRIETPGGGGFGARDRR